MPFHRFPIIPFMSKTPPPLPPEKNFLKIQRKLEETRQQIYWQEWAERLLTLSCWGTAFLGMALLLDHWCFTGNAIRFVVWGIFWGGAIFFFYRNLLPLLRHRIHPLYAADTLEKEYPQLKNRLLNLLFLKKEPSFRQNTSKSAAILASLEQQTLVHLNQMESRKKERQIFFQRGILLGFLLLALFFYTLFSPKSSWTSVKRILFPWETIAAPKRVRLEEILPGNSTVLAGETLMISAKIRNLRPDEKVTVVYSTRDRQVADQTLPMTPLQENRFEAILGDWPEGIQTPLTWKIQAGDACSETFQVDVAPPLRIVVKEVLLTPPAYMQLPIQKENNPDFQGWDGSEGTLHVQASHAMDEGYLEMWPEQNPSEKRRLPLEVEKQNPQQGTVRFSLRFSPWNHPTAEEATQETFFYTLHYKHENHTSNPTPPLHQMTVLPDQFPQIRLISFPEEGCVLPWGKPAEIVLEAEDIDFALRGVAFRARWNGKNLDIPPILNLPLSEAGVRGVFQTRYRWNPAEWNLKPGDSIQWWVEAIDTRLPEANRTVTLRRTLHWAELSESVREEEPESAEKAPSPDSAEKGEKQMLEAENSHETGTDPQDERQEEADTHAEKNTHPSQETSEEETENGEAETEGESGIKEGEEQGKESENPGGKTEPKTAPSDFDPLSPENAASQEVPSSQGEESSESSEKKDEEKERNGENHSEKKGKSRQNSSSLSEEENPSEAQEDGGQNPSAGASPVSEETSPGEEESPDAEAQGTGEKDSVDSPSIQDAKPGKEKGTSSQHDFAQPGGEKEDFQMDNLRESENLHQKERPGLVDNSSEGGKNSASTPKDGESDPGGAFEEILKHQQQTTGKGAKKDASAPPEKAEEDGGDWEMEKQDSPTPSEKASSPQEPGKSSPRMGNDTQKGDASSRPESMRDLSVEGSTRERDRHPGTQKGGQEESQQQGIGRAGNHTPNEEGNPSGSGGDGPLDSHGGEGKITDEKTGFSNPQQAGNSDTTRPNEKGSQKRAGNQAETSPSSSATPTVSSEAAPSPQRSESRTEQGSGWSDGKSDKPGTPDFAEATSADQANAEYARQQTLLALNHLQDMLERDDETLLKQLGWSREEAMAFLQKWQQIHQAASEKNLSTQQRQQLERTFRNLGLSPRTELERETQQERRKVYLHSTLQTPPPENWREILEAYSRGVAGEGTR